MTSQLRWLQRRMLGSEEGRAQATGRARSLCPVAAIRKELVRRSRTLACFSPAWRTTGIALDTGDWSAGGGIDHVR